MLVTLAAGAALVLYVLVARVRRRYAAGGPDAVTERATTNRLDPRNRLRANVLVT